MACRPGPRPHGPGSFAVGLALGIHRSCSESCRDGQFKPPASGTRAARVTDYTGNPGCLAPSKEFLSALEGLIPVRSGTRSPRWRQRPAGALGPREPTTPTGVRPKVTSIAAGGEPGERGRYEDRKMLKRTPAWAGPGPRTAKGVSNFDSGTPTAAWISPGSPVDEGTVKF